MAGPALGAAAGAAAAREQEVLFSGAALKAQLLDVFELTRRSEEEEEEAEPREGVARAAQTGLPRAGVGAGGRAAGAAAGQDDTKLGKLARRVAPRPDAAAAESSGPAELRAWEESGGEEEEAAAGLAASSRAAAVGRSPANRRDRRKRTYQDLVREQEALARAAAAPGWPAQSDDAVLNGAGRSGEQGEASASGSIETKSGRDIKRKRRNKNKNKASDDFGGGSTAHGQSSEPVSVASSILTPAPVAERLSQTQPAAGKRARAPVPGEKPAASETEAAAVNHAPHRQPSRQQPSQPSRSQPLQQSQSSQQQEPSQPQQQQPSPRLQQQPQHQAASESVSNKKGHWAPGAQWQGGDADGAQRKRTKTRSKQKNRRRDKRPEGSWMKNATGAG
jgi:hypothetical protein